MTPSSRSSSSSRKSLACLSGILYGGIVCYRVTFFIPTRLGKGEILFAIVELDRRICEYLFSPSIIVISFTIPVTLSSTMPATKIDFVNHCRVRLAAAAITYFYRVPN